MAEGALSLIATPAVEVVDQVLAIPVELIDVGGRLRPVDPVWAKALGGIMASEGQRTPIEVCQLPGRTGYLLVAGGHRLEAARHIGWKRIRAILVDSNAVDRRMRELSENLWRRDLNPLDRAAFVAELVQLHKAKVGLVEGQDGRSASVAARWQKALKEQAANTSANIALVYGWADEVGERLGFSRRSIYNALELHRGLPPALIARIRALPIAANAGQLRALARLAESEQRAVVELLAEGKAKGCADALGILRQKPRPDMARKAWSAFFGGWTRMNARAQREALRELAQHTLPKGVRIVFDEADA